MKKINRSKKGFTLVEMMISISILLILISMLTVIFRATQESFIQASSMQRVFDTCRSIIQRMHDEVSAAFFGPLGKTGLLGIDASGSRIKTGSQGDEIFLYVPLFELETADVVEIGYWLRADGNLIRHYQEKSDYNFTTVDADDELGLIIDQLEFTYYDGDVYQDTWDSRVNGPEAGKAPKAVRISFSVSDKKQLLTKAFETMVHISSGKRY